MRKVIGILTALSLVCATVFSVSYTNNTYQKLAEEYTVKAQKALDAGYYELAEEYAAEAKKNAAVPVIREPETGIAELDTGIHKVVIIAKLSRYDKLRKAINDLGVTGMTVTQVMGCGVQKGAGERYRGVEIDATLLPKVKLEVVVSAIPVEKVIEAAKKTLYTGHIGDGKIFVYNVQKVVKIRTGEEDYAALQDVE